MSAADDVATADAGSGEALQKDTASSTLRYQALRQIDFRTAPRFDTFRKRVSQHESKIATIGPSLPSRWMRMCFYLASIRETKYMTARLDPGVQDVIERITRASTTSSPIATCPHDWSIQAQEMSCFEASVNVHKTAVGVKLAAH